MALQVDLQLDFNILTWLLSYLNMVIHSIIQLFNFYMVIQHLNQQIKCTSMALQVIIQLVLTSIGITLS